MLYILGAGSMAKEILSFYADMHQDNLVKGFIEQDCKREHVEIKDKPIYSENILNNLSPENIKLIAAIGSVKRKEWIEELELKQFIFDTFIHKSVITNASCSVGKGCIICPGTTLTTDIIINNHTIININCSINHDTIIGNYVTIGPGVNIAGNVTVKDRCQIGIGVKVINDVVIGPNTIIGAGSVVTKDIPANVLALGIPARPIKTITDENLNNFLISDK